MSSVPVITAPSEWRQHWHVLPPCLAGIILCAVHGYSMGVMIGPLEQEFGWLRAEISAGLMLISFVALFGAPMVGTAIDRFGPRRIALFGVPFFCFTLAMLSTATSNIWTWWGLWGVLALASMFVIPTVWTAAINGYFSKNRGMALAIALSGTGISAAFVPTLTNLLMESFGWRGAYIGLGVISVAVVLPLTWFLFHPVGGRKTPANNRDDTAPATPLSGMSPKEGLRSPNFIKIAASVAIFSMAMCALTTNAVPVLIAQGFTAAKAAGIAGLIGIGSVIGRLGGGYLLDRLDANKVAAFSVLLPTVTIALFLAFPGSMVVASIACVVLGLSVGAEVDACAYLAARHFGLRCFGTLFGTINGLMLFGNGIAPIIANYVYDVTRSYDLVMWGLIPACVASSILFLMLGAYPIFDEPKLPTALEPS